MMGSGSARGCGGAGGRCEVDAAGLKPFGLSAATRAADGGAPRRT